MWITKGELEQQIEALKTQREKVSAPCEVYSRIVGYLRPVGSWNIGKKEEFKQRKLYKSYNGKELPK